MSELYRFLSTTHIDGQSKIVTLYWTVPNFTMLLDNPSNREFRSNKVKDYADSPCEEIKFQLKMQFFGRENDLIEIYYLTPEPIFLKSFLSVCLKSNKRKERSLATKDYQNVQSNKWQFLATLLKRDILNYEGAGPYLNEGSLHLKFVFMIQGDIKANNSNIPNPQLSFDLENLLQSTMYSDITIKSSEGAEFHVHKVLLIARSAVLKAHFGHNTRETLTNIIESPLETEVLQEVLTYIYTDNAPKVDEMPEKLLAAADFYQLSRLKSLCEEALHKKLTVDNAIDTLQLADLHSATNLKRMTLEFIHDGHAKLIIKTKSWDKMMSVALIKTMFEYILNNGAQDEDLL